MNYLYLNPVAQSLKQHALIEAFNIFFSSQERSETAEMPGLHFNATVNPTVKRTGPAKNLWRSFFIMQPRELGVFAQ